jgi:hypothetical protein
MILREPADPFAALVREFELELVHLKQCPLAEEEHRTLVAGTSRAPTRFRPKSLVQLHALELCTAQRAAYLARQGFTADASGLAACVLAAGSRGRTLTVAWKRVADALADLRDLTEENGTLLRARLAELGGPALARLEP